MVSEEIIEWCQRLPKIELHAHIHGSIRPSTLNELLLEEAQWNNTEPLRLPAARTLDECFEMFHLIHQVVVSRRVLRRIVIEAIEDFAKENVRYLELRSTPRELERDGASRWDYVAEVVSALEECHARSDLNITVRLILSINRNQSVGIAQETVEMAIKWKKKCPYIVGIDLSGHSKRPDSEFHRFEHVLEQARANGLKLAVHFAEHFDDAEAERILNFRPDRLGHAYYLSDAHYAKMVALRIPIEICLTSNVHTFTRYHNKCDCSFKDRSGLCICDFRAHPHRELLTGDLGDHRGSGTASTMYPICICTDDCGVMDTTVSKEYVRLADAFGLGKDRLLEIAQAAIPMIFDSAERPRLAICFKPLLEPTVGK